MLTFESRLFFGYAGLAGLTGFFYLIVSGDEMGGLLLFALMGAAVALGALFIDVRGPQAAVADGGGGGASTAEGVGGDGTGTIAVAVAGLPQPTAWPIAAAAAVGLVLVGIATDVPLVVFGLGVLALVVVGWFLEAGRASTDRPRPQAVEAHERILWPAGLPLLTFIAIAVVVISFSRILLALSKEGATAVAFVVAVAILGVCTLVAYRPRLSSRVLTVLTWVAGLAVVMGGVVAAGAGEREFEYHGPVKVDLVAEGIAFGAEELEVPAGGQAIVEFINQDEGILHNFAVYQSEEADEIIYLGPIFEGVASREEKFPTPKAGTYFYRCDVHPVQMTGTLIVTEKEEGVGHHGG